MAKDLMRMHLESEPPDPAQFVPDLPPMLNQFIRRCCRRNPQDRYQQVSEALVDLRRLAKEVGVQTKRPEPKNYQMASIFMAYRDQQKEDFEQFLRHVRTKADELGIILKSTDLTDL